MLFSIASERLASSGSSAKRLVFAEESEETETETETESEIEEADAEAEDKSNRLSHADAARIGAFCDTGVGRRVGVERIWFEEEDEDEDEIWLDD